MKRLLSVWLSVWLLLMALPLNAFVASAEEAVILNVKDFGAVGDGKTDDEAAIWAAFECALMDYMTKSIPVTVYFPEGQYGLTSGGLYVYLPRGYGDLTVKGDGADKSTLVYLEEWTNGGSWVALRIYPRITPTSVEEYLHDITIEDMGVYDTDPVNHAWHKDKGDPGTEETHGFNIQHCVRATIKNCKVDSVGDEAIDMTHCIDSVMTDNLVINSPGAGSAGGAISVGDGSKSVTIANNTVVGSINDPSKTNWAVAVEALVEPVEDIEIINNNIQDIAGWGINLGAPNGTITNVTIHNNSIYHCRDGGIRLNGLGLTTDVQIMDNTLTKVRDGICLDGANKNGTLIHRCVIEETTNYALSVKSPTSIGTEIQNLTIRDAKWRAVYNAGTDTKIDRMMIDGSGTAGDVKDSAIIQYVGGGSCEISNSLLLNCQNRRGIQDISKIVNTYICQPEVSGYTAITGADLVQNCWVNRLVTPKSGGRIDGLVLSATADLGTHAITLLDKTGCTVTNCVFAMPSRYAVWETGASDSNTVTNNVCVGGSGVKTIGAHSVAEENVRTTALTTDQFRYRIVNEEAIVMAPLDTALTELMIPATIADYPVTAIDPWAFALCDALTSVTLPSTVTAIGDHAFFGCAALTDVYYTGSETDWDGMTIGIENGALDAAAHHYDYVVIVPGDADGDGEINNHDVALFQQYLNGWDTPVYAAAIDVNGDGRENNRDLALLLRYLNGWDVELV